MQAGASKKERPLPATLNPERSYARNEVRGYQPNPEGSHKPPKTQAVNKGIIQGIIRACNAEPGGFIYP